jgi:hypothetical protein
MFYGILILMYFYDNKKHARPHIHAEYGDHNASIAIYDGEVLIGSLPPAKMKLFQAWIEFHKKDLMADWKLAVASEPVFKIDPLKIRGERWIKSSALFRRITSLLKL